MRISAGAASQPAPVPIPPRDLRLVLPAAAAWVTAASATKLESGQALLAATVFVLICLSCLLFIFLSHGLQLIRLLVLPAAVAALILLAVAGALDGSQSGQVEDAAQAGGTLKVRLTLNSDATALGPDTYTGEQRFLVEATVREGRYLGTEFRAAAPVTIIGDDRWSEAAVGDQATVTAKASVPQANSRALALLVPLSAPRLTRSTGWMAYTHELRTEFATMAAGLSSQDGGLLPGMVIGDRSTLRPTLSEDMQATGLTHLTAVSGANCSYVIAFTFLVLRSLRAPRFLAACIAVLALLGFVLLVRPEPSVLRAAVMGAIGVFGVLSGRGKLSLTLLLLSIIALLAADPWLHSSYAFILSVAATSGLILVGPLLAARLSGLMPLAAAQLVAVPLAAQLFCMPVLVLLQPVVPLYALPANILSGPAVPFVTILGMIAVLAMIMSPSLAPPVILAAQVGTTWVAGVATRFAQAPASGLEWPQGPAGVLVSAALSAAVVGAFAASGMLRRVLVRCFARVRSARWLRWVALGCALGLMIIHLTPLGGRNTTTPAWDIAACDVGQGDAFAVRTGENSAMVIDAGPDPERIDQCLRQLSVTTVVLLVLTHLHEDHYAGAPGVFRGRTVQSLAYSSAETSLPSEVLIPAVEAGITPELISTDSSGGWGRVRWAGLWPQPGARPASENDASAVLEVTVTSPEGRFRTLFTGDIEQTAAARMLRANPHLMSAGVDVLKISHHGARNGGAKVISDLNARVGLISSGAGNSYGHPHREIVELLEREGMYAARTDQLGSIGMTVHGAELQIRSLPR